MYWESRKAREAYEMYVKVEKRAEELTRLYTEASDEIALEMRRLFRTFQLNHSLTDKEAKVLLQGIDSTQFQQVISKLRAVDPEMAAELEAPAYTARLNRLRRIQRDVDNITTSIAIASGKVMYDTMQAVGMEAYYHSVFSIQQEADAGYFFNPMTADKIDEILERNWSGENYSQRIWDNTDDLAREVKNELIKGMLTGKSPFNMSKVIYDRFHGSASNSRRLMRTEANYVANQVTLLSYIEAGIEKYIYVAVLDMRTSEICQSLDKKRFLVRKAEVGENYPPMHPWCRSTTIAWMPDYLLRNLRQSAVDAEGNRIYVPMDMSYDEWYRTIRRQNEVRSDTGLR